MFCTSHSRFLKKLQTAADFRFLIISIPHQLPDSIGPNLRQTSPRPERGVRDVVDNQLKPVEGRRGNLRQTHRSKRKLTQTPFIFTYSNPIPSFIRDIIGNVNELLSECLLFNVATKAGMADTWFIETFAFC